MIDRRRTLAGLLTATAALALPRVARAQAFPNRPLRLIAPYPPGGGIDSVARLLAAPMSEMLGQAVVVENRAGAGGSIGAAAAAQAQADGHTILLDALGHVINPLLIRDLSFDYARAFAPVSLVVTQPIIVVGSPALGIRALPDLLARLRQPGQDLSYGSSGIGSSEHLGMELFRLRTGTTPTHIPYTGSGAAATDLLGGTLQLSMLNIATVAPHAQAGRLRAIAVGGSTRHPLLPEVPTFAEAGLADFTTGSWHSLVAPRGMEPALRERVQASLREALRNPEIAARLAATGFTVEATDGGALRTIIEADLTRWGAVARSAAIVMN
ncbi:MAG: hypothetical protein EBY30_04115 [Rhodospirillales bacterium]|nr:hypothetical protein [Rhodospirillales bacterium]